MSNFLSMPERIDGELEEREELGGRILPYHHSFLDDCLRGILPHDLVLIGAPSGVGKTDLALQIAASNAMTGKRVHYLALEAEPRELERRTKFALLCREAYQCSHPQASEMNYTDWLLGRCEHICGGFNSSVDKRITKQLGNLHTYYRGAKFDSRDLATAVLTVCDETDLIVVDHLHYVDADDDENEHKSLGDTVKAIRDVSLRIGKPIVLIAHLRKRDSRAKQIVATLDDFHGSSNVVKICTQAIALDHAYDIESPKWYLAPTYVSVLKDRRGGAPRLVALSMFDRRTKSYRPDYTLGRVEQSKWTEVDNGTQPLWAKGHKPRPS